MEIEKINGKIIVIGEKEKYELDKIPQQFRKYVMSQIKGKNKNDNPKTPYSKEMKIENDMKKDCLEFTKKIFELEGIKIIDMEYLQYGPMQDLAIDCLLLIEVMGKLSWVGIDFKPTEQYLHRMNCMMEIKQLNKKFQPMPGNVYTKSLKNHFVAYVDKHHYFIYDKSYLNKLIIRKAELDPEAEKRTFSDTFTDGIEGNKKTTIVIGPAVNNKYFSIMKSNLYMREKIKDYWRYNKLTFNNIDAEKFAKEIENYIDVEVGLGRIKTPEEAERLIMQIVEFKATTTAGIHLLTEFIDNSSQEFLGSIKNRGMLILSRYLLLEKLFLIDFKYKELIGIMLMKETELFNK